MLIPFMRTPLFSHNLLFQLKEVFEYPLSSAGVDIFMRYCTCNTFVKYQSKCRLPKYSAYNIYVYVLKHFICNHFSGFSNGIVKVQVDALLNLLPYSATMRLHHSRHCILQNSPLNSLN